MNSKTEQHSSSDLLNIPSSEFVTQAYAKAAEINLSFPDVSAMLRAAAARIDTLKVLVNAASSANVERFTPDCKMHMNHEMAYMRPNPNGTFVSLGDYLTLQKERNNLNAQVRALAEFKDKVRQSFHMGELAADSAVFTNIENARRRSDCLSAVEREFFTREVPDEDYPDEMCQECNLSWGKNPSEYIADFLGELNEVRAQAVDSYGNATIAIGNDEKDQDIVYAGKQALLYAASIRAGGGVQP